MDNLPSLYSQVQALLSSAVGSDNAGDHPKAYNLYVEATNYMQRILKAESDDTRKNAVKTKSAEIARRIDELAHCIGPGAATRPFLADGRSLVRAAREAKSRLKFNDAFNAYMDALRIYERVLKMLESPGSQGAGPDEGKSLLRAVRSEMHAVLTEAEAVKLRLKSPQLPKYRTDLVIDDDQYRGTPSPLPPLPPPPPSLAGMTASSVIPSTHGVSTTTRNSRSPASSDAPVSSPALSINSNSQGNVGNTHTNACPGNNPTKQQSPSEEARLTRTELDVIRSTSFINGNLFGPWLSRDVQDTFTLPAPFVDPGGKLKLSPKQQDKFYQWKRLGAILGEECRMVSTISCEAIVQDVVTDCSFVASLCVSAAHERRFKRPLVTSHIYPQNEDGVPMYNPSGKYIVRLFVNGCWRKVVVDDYFPISESGKLMCTYTTTNDAWACVIEKAFLKVMGGYDFPGSNASIDLHVLTGWIPEHIFIRDGSFNAGTTWARIRDGCRYGDSLVTIATGPMAGSQANELGLVPSHAYAVLDVCEVDGLRLMQVKNPWNNLRWRGAYGPFDEEKWTPELQTRLGYNRETMVRRDEGIFWIDYESVCRYFDYIHLNWSTDLFPYVRAVHFAWPVEEGDPASRRPRTDVYDVGHNPQFCFEVVIPDGQPPGPVRLLISKHIQQTEENRDFIALLVHNDTDGRRIYERQTPWRESGYVNNIHSLVQFNAPPGVSRYTLVVSQKERVRTLYFTLRAYSLGKISLHSIPQYPVEHREHGQWTSVSAGGNTTNASYMDNPQYCLQISRPTTTTTTSSSSVAAEAAGAARSGPDKVSGVIILRTNHSHPIQIRVFRSGCLITQVLSINTVIDSGPYRKSFCSCRIASLDFGDYTVVVSTYQPLQFGSYDLYFAMDATFTVRPIPREGAGMRERVLHGKWIHSVNAGGSLTRSPHQYHINPKFLVEVKRPTKLIARLQAPGITPLSTINVSIYRPLGPGAQASELGALVASSGAYDFYPQGVAVKNVLLDPKVSRYYIIVPSTWDPDVAGKFVIRLYSDQPLEARSLDPPSPS
ncbi:cysteine protease [Spiromyces aspiralis]|uniref:Cysteine protease n=1 Tax=Spiromyces aspiralis TaxID=68401 RepID=A0ACC1HGX2_9FUNG|nr:cysteine protease [Spiromyces aspiralis]